MFLVIKRNAFWIMSLCAICICVLLFYSWNKLTIVDYSTLKLEGSESVTMHIDDCYNDHDRMYIRGWIYSDTYPQHGHLTVTLNDGSREYLVPIKTELRRDVSAAMNLNQDFERYGFSASIRKSGTIEKTNIINLNIIDGDTIRRNPHVCP